MAQDPRNELLERVVQRATVDRAFRARLVADPYSAIFETFGVNLTPAFRVRFIEKDPGLDLLVVLPDLEGERDELSDDELDEVAGGDGTPW
ncbi:MAG TPA: NHLP leader peptide family RiPP precursor [Longimicrobium sp.]|jgi:hypothetical protein